MSSDGIKQDVKKDTFSGFKLEIEWDFEEMKKSWIIEYDKLVGG